VNESTQTEPAQAAWPGGIAAITLFVDDLAAAKRFYSDVFQLPVFFEDKDSTVFKFGETLVNLLKTSEAHTLVAPAPVATPDMGVRFQFTLGVELLNGPTDRPWGVRTASFRDPGGHVWEIAT
jgi:lactoylglutathione lyase